MFIGFTDEWKCTSFSVDEERYITKALSFSLGECSISITYFEETLVERGIIPSILLSEKEVLMMPLKNSPNVTLKKKK